MGAIVSPGFYLGMELVKYRVHAYSDLSDNALLFSKVIAPIHSWHQGAKVKYLSR